MGFQGQPHFVMPGKLLGGLADLEADLRAEGSFWRSQVMGPQNMENTLERVKLELSAAAWQGIL